MPKRLLDSSYLNSPSLAKCSAGADDAWPRFMLFADDFGCFEVDARRMAVIGWNANRTDITAEKIDGWLEEYVAAGMAVLWTENERRYCFLTGWFGPHGQRKRTEYDPTTVAGQKGSRRHTPPPPGDLVAAVVAGTRRDHDGKPPGTRREDQTEKTNEIVPARESQIPAANPVVSRSVPAHAVASADAVADAPSRRAARLGVGDPAYPAWEHWTKAVWPKVSDSPPSPPTRHQVAGLAGLCSTHGVAEVKARMDRAAADSYWRGRLTLDDIVDRFDRFAARKEAANDRGRQAVGRDWTGQITR